MKLPGRISTFFKTVANKSSASIVNQPLLNNIELQQLQRLAQTAQDNPFLIQTDVQHQLLGERTSSYAGSGYEFAEHRRYVAGDDPRFIDWRAMARTGKLYRKVFHEERRPQLYLVVDRRNAMRFGTRQQLKVTLAVKQAIQLLYQARQQQIPCGSVILEQQANWSQASQSATGIHNIIQQLNHPCPPLPETHKEASLGNVLNELAVRLSPGCIIFLLSDFHDLDESSSSTLYQLARRHRVYARHILDTMEQQLPAHGQFALFDEQQRQTININSSDSALAKQFAHDMQQQRLKIESIFQHAGCDYQWVTGEDPVHGQ